MKRTWRKEEASRSNLSSESQWWIIATSMKSSWISILHWQWKNQLPWTNTAVYIHRWRFCIDPKLSFPRRVYFIWCFVNTHTSKRQRNPFISIVSVVIVKVGDGGHNILSPWPQHAEARECAIDYPEFHAAFYKSKLLSPQNVIWNTPFTNIFKQTIYI